MAITITYPGVYLNASAPTEPGFYLYLDTAAGAEPQPVQVQHDGQRLVAHFADGHEPDTLPLEDLHGKFTAAAPAVTQAT